MEYNIALTPLILLVLMVVGAIAVVVIVMLTARGRRTSGAIRPSAVSSPAVNRDARVEVLQQLAKQRITVDEAEARLTAMGNPVPAAIPRGEPKPSSFGVGCLIAALIVMGLIGLTVLGLIALSVARVHIADEVHGTHTPVEYHRTLRSDAEPLAEQTPSIEAEITEETVEEWEEKTR